MDDASPAARPPIELKVEYKRLNSFFADYTRNISRGWTFIKTTRPLPVGTEFIFRLLVPRLERPLAIHGEVQRIAQPGDAPAPPGDGGPADGPGMAIRFVYRLGDSRTEIASAVDALMVDSLGKRLHGLLMERGARRASAEPLGHHR